MECFEVLHLLYQLSRLLSERGMMVNICCSLALQPGDEFPEREEFVVLRVEGFSSRYMHMNCDNCVYKLRVPWKGLGFSYVT
jgi:hypothetical protein